MRVLGRTIIIKCEISFENTILIDVISAIVIIPKFPRYGTIFLQLRDLIHEQYISCTNYSGNPFRISCTQMYDPVPTDFRL